ncbi:MAG: uroporphyrinogen-III synthase [Myxococcales bacterium]|nr:uroporphyrinogen-III synthase [Myxococcales bacterium]
MADDRLRGLTILLTRPADDVRTTLDRLGEHGATALAIPLIAIGAPAESEPMDRALRDLAGYDWMIFTSANAVRRVDRRLRELALDWSYPPKIAVIGTATARALERCARRADLVPTRFVAEGLLEALPATLTGQRILFPRAEEARELLPEALRARGADLDVVTVYRTCLAEASREPLRDALSSRAVDLVIFTSASAVQAFFELVGSAPLPEALQFACIGPITARALEEQGRRAAIVPQEHTIDGLIEALLAHPSRR